jgi:hypothetical protein
MNEWVLIVQNSARLSYQILDEDNTAPAKSTWIRFLIDVIAYGCRAYGIPVPP